jgi:hypothetical protein
MISSCRIHRNPVFALLILFPLILFAQGVKINEFLYNPVGTDTGNEWIELYNNFDEEVNLNGWRLQKQSASLYTVYTFSNTVIQPYAFLLIGEANVENADITTSLALYNGSNTVAVRLISADNSYTDTVLYSSPNSNNLTDDNGAITESFAPNVYNGNVLMRYPDGEDTNDSGIDFFESSLLTPKQPNKMPVDLGVSNTHLDYTSGTLSLFTTIHNLSTWDVDNSSASLDIYLNNNLIDTIILPAVSALDSVQVTHHFEYIEANYVVITIELNYLYDGNLANNICSLSYLFGSSFAVLNEVLFRPDSTNQEWVEIFCRESVDNFVDNFFIEDAAGGKIHFSKSLEVGNYYLICRYPDALLSYYTIHDTANVILASSWAYLNTTVETLYLKDKYNTVLDVLYYNVSNWPYNTSIERVNPYSDQTIAWEMSQAEIGSTPLAPNSVMPMAKDLELQFMNIREENGNILHQLNVKNIGFNQINQFSLIIHSVLNDEMNENFVLEQEFTLTDTLEFILQSSFLPNDFVTYRYQIENWEDQNLQNNGTVGFFSRNKFPVVINEIMYNPFDGEPEWLELIVNFPVHYAPFFYLCMDNLKIEVKQNYEYFLITNNPANATNLAINYNINPEQIISGLGTLTNSGKTLSIADMNGVIIETFFYSPKWNNSIKGVSIERINPTIPSSEANWGPCMEISTPGRRNSLFSETMPFKSALSISPNPFSPFRSEVAIISYQLPEPVSTATIRIFDLKGREVCKLINQNLVGSEGSIIWNGKNDDNRCVPIGIYIVKMEATARFTEKVHQKTKTVVVGK